VFLAIFVLVAYFIGMSVFLAVGGEFNRLSPFISAAAAEAIFGGVGFYLLAMQNGWWWQVREWWKQWRVQGKIPSWCDPRLLWQ
jgi:hypothetical protein